MNDSPANDPVEALFSALTVRWSTFPEPYASELRQRLHTALEEAQAAKPEVITVAGTTTKPAVLRLSCLARCSTDSMYAREWAEFCIAAEGGAWVVYRREDHQDYAAAWTQGTALPEGLMQVLEPYLVMALYGGDSG
ncbi:MAG: hypothetical protein EA401_11255 [Planctomycetota bacterium]|nr:MAG: hypothetical protein EA401_11255 [Planctomycetota bacterium]